MGLLQKLPRLQFCCCCIDLRIGTFTLGVLGVLSSIGTALQTFFYMVNHEFLKEELRERRFPPRNIDYIMELANPILILSLISSLATLLLSLFLIVGSIQRNKTLLAIYLYINFFSVGLILIFGVVALFISSALVIFFGTLLVISLYYLFCVNSYYLLLDEEQNGTQPPPYQNKLGQ